MRVALQPAFVLHRRPYRDTSLLLEIITRDHGRIGLVARGVRSRGSRAKGILQPFIPLLLSWSGKGELSNFVGAEALAIPFQIAGPRIFSGLYANELLLRLLERHDPHPGLFEAYLQLLAALTAEELEEPALRVFEKRLLAEIGYGLLLDRDALTGTPIVSHGHYRYVLDQGPINANASAAGIDISGCSLLALRYEDLSNSLVLKETKRLIRAALDKHLQGRPLKTREVAAMCRRKQ